MVRLNLPRFVFWLDWRSRAGLNWPRRLGKSRSIPVWLPVRRIGSYPEKAAGTPDKPQAQNIVRPVLLYYPAEKANAVGTAMIVAPGGGFRTLMMSYEGVDVAKRLNQMGVDAFVLKYRTIYVDRCAPAAAGRGPATTGPQAGQNVREMAGADGQQAVRLLRQHAAEFGVRPNRIGIIGYSAGGAVVLSTVYGPSRWEAGFRGPDLRRRREFESAAGRSARRCSSRWRRMTRRSDTRGRSTCLARGEKRGCPPSCTYSRPASTAS